MPELCRLLLLSNFRAISVMKFPGLHSLQHSPPVFSPSDPTDVQSSSFGPLCQGLLFCLWSPQHVPSNFDFKNTGFLYSTKSNKTPSFCLVPACSNFFSCGKMWKMATVDWSYRAALHCTLIAAAFSTSSRIMDLATFTVPWAHRKLGKSSAF